MNFQKLMVATTLSALVAIAACSDSGEKQTSTAENDSAPAQVQIEADQPTTDSAEGASVDAADSSKPLDTETLSVRMGDSAPMTVEAMKAAVSAGGNADEIATRYVAGVERYAVLTQTYRDLVAGGTKIDDSARQLYAAIAKSAFERFGGATTAMIYASVLERGFGIEKNLPQAIELLERDSVQRLPQGKFQLARLLWRLDRDLERVHKLLMRSSKSGHAASIALFNQIEAAK